MKISIDFDLPEESEQLAMCLDGEKAHAVLWDLDQYLRSLLKYFDLDEEVDTALRDVRDKLHEYIADHGMDLENYI